MNYVVLFYGDDGSLGQTIGPITEWDDAVAMAVKLAESCDQPITGEVLQYLNETGDARLPMGSIHIGVLTDDVEE